MPAATTTTGVMDRETGVGEVGKIGAKSRVSSLGVDTEQTSTNLDSLSQVMSNLTPEKGSSGGHGASPCKMVQAGASDDFLSSLGPGASTDLPSSDTQSFTAKLRLPVLTPKVQPAKLSFPLKFDRSSFCLDFSQRTSATSDCERTTLREHRGLHKITMRSGKTSSDRPSTMKGPRLIRKRFPSAEKTHSSRLRA